MKDGGFLTVLGIVAVFEIIKLTFGVTIAVVMAIACLAFCLGMMWEAGKK